MNKNDIVGKTIKWFSSGTEKVGEVVGVIPQFHDVRKDFPFLADLPTARIVKLGSFVSQNNRLLVKITTATKLENYYAPLVPIGNVRKNVWLPNNTEVM